MSINAEEIAQNIQLWETYIEHNSTQHTRDVTIHTSIALPRQSHPGIAE